MFTRDFKNLENLTSVKTGDIWQIGRHRLLCGDSIEPAIVNRFLEGYEPKLCVTDPPYGISYKSQSLDSALYALKIKNDHIVSWAEAFRLCRAPVLYIWFSFRNFDVVGRAITEAAYSSKQMLIWKKSHFVLQRHMYHSQHEQAIVCIKNGSRMKPLWVGDRKQKSVWEVASVKPKDRIHPTQKPSGVYTIPILNHTKEGDYVIDMFAGSGVLFQACEETDRTGLGIEICPDLCEKILIRMSAAGCEIRKVENIFDECLGVANAG